MSPKTFTSLSADEQQKFYDPITFDIRNTTLIDKYKEPYNLEAMLMLASCKTLQGRKFIGGHRIDWSNLARLFPDTPYWESKHINASKFPVGTTRYYIEDVGDVTLPTDATVVNMDGMMMTETCIIKITSYLDNHESNLLPTNSNAFEIITKHTDVEGVSGSGGAAKDKHRASNLR
jgi:hypothetical protein